LVELLARHNDSSPDILGHRFWLALRKFIASSDMGASSERGGSKCDQRDEKSLAMHIEKEVLLLTVMEMRSVFI
jgi:hypothetical protein